MIYENVYGNTKPESMTTEKLPDTRIRVVLTRDVEEAEEDGQRLWRYSEAEFFLPEGRTAEEVEVDPASWWEYASEDHEEPSIDERVSILEDALAALLDA